MRLSLEERVSGGLFGVVVGDALGLPIQFEARETVRKHPVTGMQGFGAFNLPVGSWSDDSSLTLCLLTSLSEKGYDLEDIGQRFLRWYREGYLTPFGKAFDVGWTTEMAMERLEQGVPALEAGLKEERSNGNGSLMRILPAALFFAHDPDEALVRKVSDISRITHAHRRSQLACSLYALLSRSSWLEARRLKLINACNRKRRCCLPLMGLENWNIFGGFWTGNYSTFRKRKSAPAAM